jgi:hypothetical protein
VKSNMGGERYGNTYAGQSAFALHPRSAFIRWPRCACAGRPAALPTHRHGTLGCPCHRSYRTRQRRSGLRWLPHRLLGCLGRNRRVIRLRPHATCTARMASARRRGSKCKAEDMIVLLEEGAGHHWRHLKRTDGTVIVGACGKSPSQSPYLASPSARPSHQR